MGQCRVVVLASGGGSNLQALLDRADNFQVVGVVSNKPDAYALQRAQSANIPTAVIEPKAFANRQAFDLQLADQVAEFSPDLVVLAGYMLILSAPFVAQFHDRLVNIHPSLLPKYKGLKTYQRALANGEHWHGSTVHFVIPELDAGPMIMQARTAIQSDDDPSSLSARVQALEHRMYPLVVSLFAAGRIAMEDGVCTFDGQKRTQPLFMSDFI